MVVGGVVLLLLLQGWWWCWVPWLVVPVYSCGLSQILIDLMRPLFDKGIRPEAWSDTLLELHTKRYTRAYVKRELLLTRDRGLNPSKEADMLSTFGDKSKCATPWV